MAGYIITLLHFLTKYGSTGRSIFKVLLRYFTGKCELQRLCEVYSWNYDSCKAIEYCLYHSKNDDIRRLLVTDTMKVKDCIHTILRVKRIIPEKNEEFVLSMTKYMRKIISYNMLLTEVDSLRNIKYSEENVDHEKLLTETWMCLKNETLEERYTKRWSEIGFQGKNPATDFRGMGLLAMSNLYFLVSDEETRNISLKIFGQSQHPQFGFPFAVASINITSLTFDFLRDGKLKGYFYNLENTPDYNLRSYQICFADIFRQFADFYVKKEPENIMSFNTIKDEFQSIISKRLMNGKW